MQFFFAVLFVILTLSNVMSVVTPFFTTTLFVVVLPVIR